MWALIITLVFTGLLLLGLELLVIPGFGIAGILGLGSFAASCYLAFANFGAATGVCVVVALIVLVTLFVVLVLRSKTWKKISSSAKITTRE